jgi:hypothetical protein
MDTTGDLDAPRRGERAGLGLGSGLLGGLALAAPILIWDWARTSHLALELPMAATAWLFGLEHFSHVHYLGWPIVIGIALLCAYWALSGLAYAWLAERVAGTTRPLTSLAAGFAWSFVSFIFFWNMLLPIARGGAPFRVSGGSTSVVPEPAFVAPNWVWILGFVLMGLVTSAAYAALRGSPTARAEVRDGRDPSRAALHRAA